MPGTITIVFSHFSELYAMFFTSFHFQMKVLKCIILIKFSKKSSTDTYIYLSDNGTSGCRGPFILRIQL